MSTKISQTKTKDKLDTSEDYVEPMAYTPAKGESIFTFKNLYCEYARFHKDDTNIWIHIFFIPILVFTILGMGIYWDSFNQTQIDYSNGYSIKIGHFDMPSENENRVVFWNQYVFITACALIYLVADPIIGIITTTCMLSLCHGAFYLHNMDV